MFAAQPSIYNISPVFDQNVVVANGIMGISVFSLKKIIYAPRPDRSANDGFPSGHTSTAFVGAEFMRQEYRDRSAWYGVAGYALGAHDRQNPE